MSAFARLSPVQARIFKCQPFILDSTSGLARDPPIAEEFRDAAFFDNYDFTTLIYDVALRGHEAVLLAPPFLNLRGIVEQARFRCDVLDHELTKQIISLDRHDQIRILLPPRATTLFMQSGAGDLSFRLTEEDARFFAGRRVVFTKSRNNELVWLTDWARYYQRIHGADAVLVFDNASSRYGPEDIVAALRAVPGLARIGVVDWPFPFGLHPGKHDIWNSDHCQIGAQEAAHLRFLPRARSVVSVDIDELMYVRGGRSVFDLVEASGEAILTSDGIWATLVDPARVDGSESPVRHREFRHTLRPEIQTATRKWAAVPGRNPKAQWNIHGFDAQQQAPHADLHHWHFRQVSTGWRYDRSGVESRERVSFDPELEAHMLWAFGALADPEAPSWGRKWLSRFASLGARSKLGH